VTGEISTRALAVFAALCLVGRVAFDAWQLHRRRRALDRWTPVGGGPMRLAPDPARTTETMILDREAAGLLPPEGSWCGCCGRPCEDTALWCDDCALHVTHDGQPHECTYHAQHGIPCPFEDQGDEDCTAEGLGPRIFERKPSPAWPLEAGDDPELHALVRETPA